MYPAIVTVRLSSSRLPSKALLRLGGYSVLQFVIERARAGGMTPFVFTSSDSSDDPILSEARHAGAPVFRGNLENKVDRWARGFEAFDLEDGHLVDADDPFFDPVSCLLSLDKLRNSAEKYVILPSKLSDSGEAYVGTSITRLGLQRAASELDRLSIFDTDVVPWGSIFGQNEMGRSDESAGSPRFRLTLDYAEDFKVIKKLSKEFDYKTPRADIEEYLLRSPDLIAINFFRNQQFLENKANHLRRNGVQHAPR